LLVDEEEWMVFFTELLDAEWEGIASGAAARGRVREWGRQQPALEGFGDAQEVIEGRKRLPLRAPAILEALARLAPSDELAARTLLQALLPGLVRLAGHLDKADLTVNEEVVSLAWERIRTYPACRSGDVAANILRDVRKRYWQDRAIEAPLSPRLTPGRERGRAPSAEDEALGRIAFEQMVESTRQLMGDHGTGLLLRTRVLDKTLETVAAEDEVSVHAVRVRRNRAEQCLRPLRQSGRPTRPMPSHRRSAGGDNT
jgi:hypothetical protein